MRCWSCRTKYRRYSLYLPDGLDISCGNWWTARMLTCSYERLRYFSYNTWVVQGLGLASRYDLYTIWFKTWTFQFALQQTISVCSIHGYKPISILIMFCFRYFNAFADVILKLRQNVRYFAQSSKWCKYLWLDCNQITIIILVCFLIFK